MVCGLLPFERGKRVDEVSGSLLRQTEVILALQIQPKCWTHAKQVAEPEGCVPYGGVGSQINQFRKAREEKTSFGPLLLVLSIRRGISHLRRATRLTVQKSPVRHA